MNRHRIQWSKTLAAAVLSSSLGLGLAHAVPAVAAPLSDAAGPLAELAKQAQDSSKPEADRVALITALGQWETDQVREPLLAMLGDPLPGIRAAAARALGWKGNVAVVASLKQRVEAPGEAAIVRAGALEALGKIGDPSVRELLVAGTRDPDPGVREASLRALSTGPLMQSADQALFLRQLAAGTDYDLMLRSQAIQGLGALKDTGATELLIGLIESGPPFPMPNLSPNPSQPEVMMIRYRQARDVKAWSARALGLIGAKSALPVLMKAAEEPSDFFLRMLSIEVLGLWKAPGAVPVLIRRLDDRYDFARIAALWALAEIGDRSALDAVIARLADREPKVRAQAAKTLGQLGDPRAREQLDIAQQRDLDPDVQEAVARALEQLQR